MVIGADADPALPELEPREQELIERAETLGRGLLAEQATRIDRGELTVHENIAALAEAGIAGATAPRAYGGSGVRPAVELRLLEALCYGDATTPFVIAQHFGTAKMLAHGENVRLADAVLPLMARGELLAGFGISHIRRAGTPVLAAVPEGDGYRLDGAIPWMTGYGIFSHVVVAGTLPDGQALSAWVPLEDSPEMRISPPMELVAMNAAQTVSATVEGLYVRRDDIVSIGPNALRGRPSTPPVPCLYGIIRACTDDLATLAERRAAPAIAAAAARLVARLERQRPPFYDLVSRRGDPDTVPELAEARAGATRLALDATGALIVATGGGANAATHPAQRRLRETSVLATWGVSPEAVGIAVGLLSAEPE